MTYTLTQTPDIIVRDEDQAFIPADPDNVDYQEFLAWTKKGGKAKPYTPPSTSTSKPAPKSG